ncbi:MAG: GNAT family N-acetyltransferase [Ectothiorhodospiraceae bacterium]|nr:GNAT family N-acetyltransferase [Ectothiorhodospiraceae bacterium]
MIRAASLNDLPALLMLEQCCFPGDRLSRRSFRYLLLHGHTAMLVDERDHVLTGYLLMLFRRGSRAARIYSIATGSRYRGQGVAEGLVRAAEQIALEKGATEIRLEVRSDNRASRKLFQRLGYRPFAVLPGYYHDGMDAVRYRRSLLPVHSGAAP